MLYCFRPTRGEQIIITLQERVWTLATDLTYLIHSGVVTKNDDILSIRWRSFIRFAEVKQVLQSDVISNGRIANQKFPLAVSSLKGARRERQTREICLSCYASCSGLSQLWLHLGIFIVCFRRIAKPCHKPNRHPKGLAQRPQDMLNLFRNSLLAMWQLYKQMQLNFCSFYDLKSRVCKFSTVKCLLNAAVLYFQP